MTYYQSCPHCGANLDPGARALLPARISRSLDQRIFFDDLERARQYCPPYYLAAVAILCYYACEDGLKYVHGFAAENLTNAVQLLRAAQRHYPQDALFFQIGIDHIRYYWTPQNIERSYTHEISL